VTPTSTTLFKFDVVESTASGFRHSAETYIIPRRSFQIHLRFSSLHVSSGFPYLGQTQPVRYDTWFPFSLGSPSLPSSKPYIISFDYVGKRVIRHCFIYIRHALSAMYMLYSARSHVPEGIRCASLVVLPRRLPGAWAMNTTLPISTPISLFQSNDCRSEQPCLGEPRCWNGSQNLFVGTMRSKRVMLCTE
jgi:hypothetical protein